MLAVREIMQTQPATVSPEMKLTDIERFFLTSGFEGFPVVKEDRLIGVISRSDIVRSLVTEMSRAEQISDFQATAERSDGTDQKEILESIAAHVGIRLSGLSVEDAMVRTVVSIESSEPIQRLAELMVEGRLHRLPVVDGHRLVGLVSTLDLVRAIAEGRLEEAGPVMDSEHLIGRTRQ